jgi:2-polyprenyl-6-methoxyphenol hydroxylase-like FAD-dependent oxidoreductase
MRILIVGAGIAGLALARALEMRGMVADIVERRDVVQAPGAGLYMPGNATRAVEQLGLLDELRGSAVDIKRQLFLDAQGKRLFHVDVDDVWHPAGACLSTRRVNLQQILQRSLKQTSITHGRRLVTINQTPVATCEVTFDDGGRATYDLVVGADGVNSTVRSLMISDQPPDYAGFICWRFMTRNDAGISGWTAMLGGDRTLLAIPVSQQDVYVYADLIARDGKPPANFEQAGLRSLFQDFNGPVVPLLSAAEARTDLHFGRIEEVRLDNWVNGHVVLLGDAAHASSPSMAEGAGMALEDALVLAEAIATAPHIHVALQRFQARRQHRVNWVQKHATARDRARKLPKLARTAILKWMGTRMYRRSYQPLLTPA